ncbi:MAG TPA: ArsR family transcriptional regulator [Epsilonproteobacteria bacterium]|nr:ArsR family transcriptional regulator [Campylobacterota bacterium]
MEDFLQTIGALNDETRLRLLHFIDTHGAVCVCDIEQSFEMVQSRVSRHLKILKEAGFLRVERKGRWAYYSIRTPMDSFRQGALKEISYLETELPELQRSCSPVTI